MSPAQAAQPAQPAPKRVPQYIVVKIAAAVEVDVRTVRRYFDGLPVRQLKGDRIAAEAKRLGWPKPA